RFAGAFRTELDKVVVALDEGNEPRDLDKLGTAAAQFGVETDGLDQKVDPLFGRELTTGRDVAVEVEVRELDGLDRAENPRHDAGVVAVEVLDVADAPDPADEELGMSRDRRRLDEHLLDAEISELCLVDIVLVVEGDRDLVNDLVAAPLTDSGL